MISVDKASDCQSGYARPLARREEGSTELRAAGLDSLNDIKKVLQRYSSPARDGTMKFGHAVRSSPGEGDQLGP